MSHAGTAQKIFSTARIMEIRDLLAEDGRREITVIHPDNSLREAARIMNSHNIGSLVVCSKERKIVGIISERNLLRAISDFDKGLFEKRVSDIMTRSVITCSLDENLAEVLSLMKKNSVRHIPVLKYNELVGIVSIRELTQAYELLQAEANTDALTGLSNRRSLLKALESELGRASRFGHPLSVAMIDVDHFKHVNDTFGHQAGDKVLCTLAKFLIRELRSINKVGRLGGEEFVAIFPETNISGAGLVCNRLLDTISAAEVDLGVAKISFTVSIGLTEVNGAMDGPLGILNRADELMYDAKVRGRNCIQVDTVHVREVAQPCEAQG